MKIKVVDKSFSIYQCKSLDKSILNQDHIFISKTIDEISVVCETSLVPSIITVVDDGWKCLKIDEVLDFSQVGVLAKISKILADNQISIFVVSTYNTDYILIKEQNLYKAIELLKQNNYIFNEMEGEEI